MTRYTSRLDAKTGLVTQRALTEEEETARDAAEKDYADREPTRKWSELRNLRDELLQSSDWTQAADTALTDSKKAEWVIYRDKLRKLPAQYDNSSVVGTITWPDPPS